MDFATLLEQCDPPAEIVRLSLELIAQKAVTCELGAGPLPKPIRTFIDAEFEAARTHFSTQAHRLSEEARKDAEAFFRSTLDD
jgi:predicted nucleotidyltransferase